MSAEQHSIKHVSIHNYKDEKLEWKSVQRTGDFFNVWEKAKEVLPLTSLMGTSDLQGCWSRNEPQLSQVSQVLFTALLKSAEERSTPKGIFSTRIFSDKFQLLPPVVPALNLMSSSTQMHRSALYLHQSSLEKLTVHQTCRIWTTPEIKLWKSTTSWIFLLSVKSTTEILTVTCPCLAFRLHIQVPYKERNKVERMASHLFTFSRNW